MGNANSKILDNVEQLEFGPKPKPILGYPELHWTGKRPFTSTAFYPAQLREVYGEDVNKWRNKLYWGDNLQVMSHLLKNYRGKVDLIYIDPPFDSKATYGRKIIAKGETVTNDQNVFEEKQYSDIWTNDEYLQFMYERLVLARELLTDSGAIYLHCDYRKSHHLRCILDEVFGIGNCLNEIVWSYTTGGVGARFFNRKHDVIYFYVKNTDNYTFNQLLEKSYFSMPRYKLNPDMESGKRLGVKEDEKGVYREVGMRDVWDVKALFRNSQERNGYPTQKPEGILERIIRTSSNEGDLVFDFFMGSGTTPSAAMKLGRRFIGADINLGAIQTTTKRLYKQIQKLNNQEWQDELFPADEIDEEVESETELLIGNNGEPETIYSGFEVYNVNHYDVFRNPVEARELLLDALEINKLPQGQLFDGEKDGRLVKLMPVNRIATRADLGELIAGLDLKAFEKRHKKNPNEPVERITLVCMGHEPDLGASLEKEVEPYKLDVEVVDILRDRQDLQFKRDSEAKVIIKNGKLVIESFYPMNLLGKLSLQKEKVKKWQELVESVMIDWNYDGAVLTPATVDIPEKNELVTGKYTVPSDAGTIRVKITDLLSESLEVEVSNG